MNQLNRYETSKSKLNKQRFKTNFNGKNAKKREQRIKPIQKSKHQNFLKSEKISGKKIK